MEDGNNNQIPNWLTRRVEATPDNKALLSSGVWLTWRELYELVQDTAEKLSGLGICPGMRVALLLGNSQEFVVILHALGQMGATVVPLNLRLTPAELSWQINDIKAELLVYAEGQHELANAIRTEIICPILVITELNDKPKTTFSPQKYFELNTVHSIIYSSGTTGKPKGVLLTYGNHFWNAIASVLNLGHQHNDCWLAVLPLFHVGGMSILLRSVVYGIPTIVHESFDPTAVNRTIDEDGVTIISVVANILQRMLDERGDKPYPPTLRCVLAGGGPVPKPLLERCAALNIPVTQTYGMSETASQAVTLAPEDAMRKLGSAGKVLYPSELRVENEGQTVKVCEVGEILIRGPIVTPGYAGRPEETDRALQDGWLHTGDLGKLDVEGYLYIVDRRTDLIISGGENIYPAEVEAVLLAHPQIEEAGVIGLQDERWGQIVVAGVKLRPNSYLTEKEIIEWCVTRLAKYKVPKQVKFLESLPRNAAGKLVRRQLREDWNL